jgi:hypothetical protein
MNMAMLASITALAVSAVTATVVVWRSTHHEPGNSLFNTPARAESKEKVAV